MMQQNDNTPDERDDASGSEQGPALAQCPPFTAARLQRQLLIDQAMRFGLVMVIVLLLVPTMVTALTDRALAQPEWTNAAMLVALAGWLGMAMINTGAARRLARATLLMDFDHERAEAELAGALKPLALNRTLRILLYQRLALLRHRQGNYAESGAICQAVLNQPLGKAEHVRVPLLLILIESRLTEGDGVAAYAGIMQLRARPIALLESLQLLALQTRYEVQLGYDDSALSRIAEKTRMAELMPAPQCGAMHAMLAASARRASRAGLAAWLRGRAELLCSSEQLRTIDHVWKPVAPDDAD
ncbi:MAG: hypothetical protein WD768_16630 [Phycisphaeraceae bacterium]